MKIYKSILLILVTIICQLTHAAQGLELPEPLLDQPIDWKSPSTNEAMHAWAEQIYTNKDPSIEAIKHVAILSLLKLDDEVFKLIKKLKDKKDEQLSFSLIPYELFINARINQRQSTDFETAFIQAFNQLSSGVSDDQIYRMGRHQSYNLKQGMSYLNSLLDNIRNKEKISDQERLNLMTEFQRFRVYMTIKTPLDKSLKLELAKRYIIDEKVLIKTKTGITLSAVVVRKKGLKTRQPTALMSNIYTNEIRNKWTAIKAANYGYVGMVSDTRGKRLSPDKIEPYEHDGKDTHDVIDWISKQSWSDGQIGMYGGSYSGFVQWSAAEYQHPALKTIVPYVAAIPGQGLPMENNVFLTANYAWPFYVANNKFLDTDLYNDNNRWQELNDKWYQSGRSFREIDKVDGLDNPWLQKWLDHPAYDAYWQAMVPYKDEFKIINIPVLSVTGYFDDGQISAIHYLKEHEKYNPQQNHFLLIGPYDHFGAQGKPSSHLRGYDIDPVAQIDIEAITFAWLDHVMKGGTKPALLKDKINYQVMGSNQWLNAPSLKDLNRVKQRYFLTTKNNQGQLLLSPTSEPELKSLSQEVDLKDRSKSNNQYYPWPIINSELNVPNDLAYITEAFDEDHEYSGTMSGEMVIKTNKKDFDFGLVVYELLPNGQTFHLGYYLGRASYAKDMSQRQLLEPNKRQNIPFERSRMTSKLIKKGSRIVVLVNVNKNSGAQVNFGTGKDVSNEDISDGDEALKVEWYNSSFIDLPLKLWADK